MLHSRLLSLAFFAILFCFPLKAQQNREAKEKDDPGKAAERFSAIRNDPAVANREYARWEAYRQNNARMLQSNTPLAVANWQSCGPGNQGGRMISHAFDPFNNQILWAGAASGGLWRSADGGISWSAMTDDLPCMAIGAIGINPQNPMEMLLGTGEGYVFSTFQFGIGVLRSTDGGLSWNTTSLVVPDSTGFACLGFAWDPINPQHIVLASTYGLYLSIDGGQSWNLTEQGVATAIVLNKQNPSLVYAAMQRYGSLSGGIFKSVNGGNSWTQLQSGLPLGTNTGFTSLAICDSFPDVLFAGISYPYTSSLFGKLEGFYKTSDAGQNWTQLSTGYDFYCYPAPYDYICQGWYGNITAVSPVDTNIVYAGGIYLYQSTDGGGTWNYSDFVPADTPPYMHPDHHSFAFDPTNPAVQYSFNDGGIYKTVNGGYSWDLANSGLVTTQFYYIGSSATNPNLVLGGTQDNGVWYNYTMNAPLNWVKLVAGDGFMTVVDYTDANTWYFTELFNTRMKSRDGGATYDTIQNGISGNNMFITPMFMHPTDHKTLFTATDAVVYRTTDSAANWVPVFLASNIITFTFDQVNPNIMYICSDPLFQTSDLYRSTDGGTTWTAIASPGDKVTDIETDPNVSGTLYATRARYSSGQQIFKSVDAGNSWINISSDFPPVPANTIAINPNNSSHLYIGSDLGVYLSLNGGAAWTSYNDNLPFVVVNDIHYYAADSSIRAGTYGRGFWKTPAADPSLTAIANPQAVPELSAIHIYPNPAVHSATIRYSLAKDEFVTVRIYNALGQEIRMLSAENQNAGTHTLNWDCKNSLNQNVTAGIYFVRITAGDLAWSERVVVKAAD